MSSARTCRLCKSSVGIPGAFVSCACRVAGEHRLHLLSGQAHRVASRARTCAFSPHSPCAEDLCSDSAWPRWRLTVPCGSATSSSEEEVAGQRRPQVRLPADGGYRDTVTKQRECAVAGAGEVQEARSAGPVLDHLVDSVRRESALLAKPQPRIGRVCGTARMYRARPWSRSTAPSHVGPLAMMCTTRDRRTLS